MHIHLAHMVAVPLFAHQQNGHKLVSQADSATVPALASFNCSKANTVPESGTNGRYFLSRGANARRQVARFFGFSEISLDG
jgi:hypothetical protein